MQELNKIIIEHLKGNYETDYDNRGKDHRSGGTLKELLYLYHQENESKWKDAASIKAIHNRILHMLGDVPLDEIDRQRCVQFRNDLKEYPLRNRDFNTPWRKLSEKKLSRLSERTQNGTMTELSTLLNYAVSAFGIKSNPASGLAKSKSECKPQKTREEYSKIELNKMVKVLAEVNRAKKPEVFWIPLLLLYTVLDRMKYVGYDVMILVMVLFISEIDLNIIKEQKTRKTGRFLFMLLF